MKCCDFITQDSGQSLVLGALGILVVISIVGISVDVGSLYVNERKLHLVAETAALAGALEVESCQGVTGCNALQTAAATSLAENGLTASSITTNCGHLTATQGIGLTVNNPPCALGASDPNAGDPAYVETVVEDLAPTYFAKVIGINLLPIIARAEAKKTANPNCIYALDPNAGNAITVDILASLNSSCGVIDESNAANAFSCNLLAGVHASRFKITGGTQSFLCNSSPAPLTGAPLPSPTDPLAYLPTPSVTSCGSSFSSPYYGSSAPLLIAGTATLYPDHAYCGGITILPTANVTFMPGTYVLRSGGVLGLQGGLSVNLLANVTGNGVTFYNYGPNGGITFALSSVALGTQTLVAPTTGTYAGILFFQDKSNATPAIIAGSTSLNSKIEGALYFPSAHVLTALCGPAKYSIVVAKDIEIGVLSFGSASLSSSTFGNDYSTLMNGSPLQGSGATLVQ